MKALNVLIAILGLALLPISATSVQVVKVAVPAPSPDPTAPILQAMTVLAATEKTTPDQLMDDPKAVATIIADEASTAHVDPLLLTTIAWTETRFRSEMKGDHGHSCGMTQIRTDFHGRPTCAQLQDPRVAFQWTATHLNEIADKGGKIQLVRYNAGDYEVRIWRTMDWLRRQLPSNHV